MKVVDSLWVGRVDSIEHGGKGISLSTKVGFGEVLLLLLMRKSKLLLLCLFKVVNELVDFVVRERVGGTFVVAVTSISGLVTIVVTVGTVVVAVRVGMSAGRHTAGG